MILERTGFVKGVTIGRPRANIAAARPVALVDGYGVGRSVVVSPDYRRTFGNADLRRCKHHIFDVDATRF